MSNPHDTRKDLRISVLGPTLSFKGELVASEDLLIQGEIEGTIRHSSNLTIGPDGKVTADVQAEYIEVEGTVRGDLKGGKSVVVRHSADVEGNIYSPSVSVMEGSTFNGQIDMSGKQGAASEPAEAAANEPVEEVAKVPSAENDPGEPESKPAADKKPSSGAA